MPINASSSIIRTLRASIVRYSPFDRDVILDADGTGRCRASRIFLLMSDTSTTGFTTSSKNWSPLDGVIDEL
jgi:hypothetical protein